MTPTFVLTRPQMGENIGAAARAMLNFGVDRMRIVAPRDGWPNPAAVAMASGAGRVLDAATVHDTLAGALGDCTFVYATTARQRDLTKAVLSPEAAMQDASARIGDGQHVAVLFGP
ncbi:MAG: RNA methyltransferase, partial [Pseudomonadota bacterium]